MLNDAHCHFFSARFFAALGTQTAPATQNAAVAIPERLGWDPPDTPERLADRWVRELDTHHVHRAALMASVPDDEESVSVAVRRHPSRLVGLSMVDPTRPDADARLTRLFDELGIRCACLFPAMHGFRLDDDVVDRVFAAAATAGAAVFIHCGVLSVGVRRKLGLRTPVDIRLGDPLAIVPVASRYPSVPIIIPHFGAGFLKETLMAADLCASLHLDTSSSNRWLQYHPELTLRTVFAHTLQTLGPDRLLFGTDSSFFPRGWQRPVYETQRSILDDLDVGDDARHQILAGNFDRVFSQRSP
ncbi:MAG: amidohydrolase [Acidobacteria bacterium]|jgi:predicted TIM-barrel fold metal-dependent hydrolase|nr:amidohydrolase [Acidobacteriota bacterium]